MDRHIKLPHTPPKPLHQHYVQIIDNDMLNYCKALAKCVK